MELNKNNYFSVDANMEYMGATQFKDFMKCESEGLAKANGSVVEEPTKPMLVGSYVDAYFSGELDEFKANNPQILKKDGTLLKDFEQANDIIKAIEEDEMMMEYLNGKHQVIMTGIIAGVHFKIKIDSLLKNIIVDQKIMSSYKELSWNDKQHKYCDFVENFGYDIQGAIYQEIVRQNTGIRMPFVLAVATKEDGCDKALIQIDQEYLDQALKLVEELAPRYDLIKKGIVEPTHCGCCPVCRKEHKVNGVISYKQLFNKDINENEESEQ